MSVGFFKEVTYKATPSEVLRRAEDIAAVLVVAEKLTSTPEKYTAALRTFVNKDLPAAMQTFEGTAATPQKG